MYKFHCYALKAFFSLRNVQCSTTFIEYLRAHDVPKSNPELCTSVNLVGLRTTEFETPYLDLIIQLLLQ